MKQKKLIQSEPAFSVGDMVAWKDTGILAGFVTGVDYMVKTKLVDTGTGDTIETHKVLYTVSETGELNSPSKSATEDQLVSYGPATFRPIRIARIIHEIDEYCKEHSPISESDTRLPNWYHTNEKINGSRVWKIVWENKYGEHSDVINLTNEQLSSHDNYVKILQKMKKVFHEFWDNNTDEYSKKTDMIQRALSWASSMIFNFSKNKNIKSSILVKAERVDDGIKFYLDHPSTTSIILTNEDFKKIETPSDATDLLEPLILNMHSIYKTNK